MPRLARSVISLTMILALGCDGDPPPTDSGPVEERDAGTTVTVCASNDDCDDGLYCNGQETCDPDTGGDGCVAGTPPCPAAACEEATDDCGCTENPDRDDDGHDSIGCGGDDCDDDDGDRYPGNAEVCDAEGHDEDCRAETLAGSTGDADGDGYVSTACCGPNGAGGIVCGTDCDDGSNAVNIGSAESCNGVDDDCDGDTDEGVLMTFYADVDEDLYGDPDVSMTGCSAPTGYVTTAGDCDDGERTVNPAATESCNEVDDDCDETTDEEGSEVGTREHCSACGDECQFDCDAGSCPELLALHTSRFTFASTSSGVYSWGTDEYGQLARGGTGRDSSVPVSAATLAGREVRSVSGVSFMACASVDAKPWTWGRTRPAIGRTTSGASHLEPGPVSGVPESFFGTEIECSDSLACALATSGSRQGEVWCWGEGPGVGVGDDAGRPSATQVSGLPAAVSVAVGTSGFACAVVSDGRVFCWGVNSCGQLGAGTTSASNTPVQVSGISNAVSVSAGNRHACAGLADGTVRCWGLNHHFQLGDGSGAHGQTCTDGTSATPRDYSPTPVAVAGLSTADEIRAAGNHTCAIDSAGGVQCWGENDIGFLTPILTLGVATAEPDAPTPVTIAGIPAATAFSLSDVGGCAADANGLLYCWGRNANGQVGDGTEDVRNAPVRVLASP